MKALKYLILFVLIAGFSTSCKKDDKDTPPPTTTNTVTAPARFRVEIPQSISGKQSGKTSDAIKGEDIYQQLRTFVFFGDLSAKMIEGVINIIRTHQLRAPMIFTFKSDEDGRTKTCTVNSNVTYAGRTWQNELQILDTDGALAYQLVWDNTPALEGTAIMNLHHFDRRNPASMSDAFYRVDYSEKATENFDRTMTVGLCNLPDRVRAEKGYMDNLKLFVGQKGDILTVQGNSNHPRLTLFDPTFRGGRSYAFVGKSDKTKNISVVELGLPPSGHASNQDVLTTYSVFNVLDSEIKAVGVSNQQLIDSYLANAKAPGYFNATGFVSSGEAMPSPDYQPLKTLSNLRPFVPQDVRSLQINFLR